MNKELLELYSNYLMSSSSQTTATGLSTALDGQISHDKLTRFLSERDFDSKQLGLPVKPVVRPDERDDGVIIFDDTVAEKPQTKASDRVCGHHSKNRSVKGINRLNCLYPVAEVTLPLGFDWVSKPVRLGDIATKKAKRKGTVTQNERRRRHWEAGRCNRLKYGYVLTDSWFSSQENMTFIHQDLDKHFIMALKSNRTVALSEEDRKPGHFTRIDSLEWTEHTPGWIKRVDFPVLLHRQVFTNPDGSSGTWYLACSD